MKSARVRLALLIVAYLGGLSTPGALAEVVHKTRRSTPAHPSRSAPDVTATISKQPPPLQREPPAAVNGNEIPPPYKLPVASRARVRACGETWRDMKLAGTTGDDDWRDFALKCLVARPTQIAE